MKKGVYLIVGWVFILITVLVGLASFIPVMKSSMSVKFATIIQPMCILGSCFLIKAINFIFYLIILALFLIPGIYYIRAKKLNKLTNWAAGLTLASLILVVLTILLLLIQCSGSSGECLAWGIALFGLPFGLIPAGFLYVISIILLIINWIKNR